MIRHNMNDMTGMSARSAGAEIMRSTINRHEINRVYWYNFSLPCMNSDYKFYAGKIVSFTEILIGKLDLHADESETFVYSRSHECIRRNLEEVVVSFGEGKDCN